MSQGFNNQLYIISIAHKGRRGLRMETSDPKSLHSQGETLTTRKWHRASSKAECKAYSHTVGDESLLLAFFSFKLTLVDQLYMQQWSKGDEWSLISSK